VGFYIHPGKGGIRAGLKNGTRLSCRLPRPLCALENSPFLCAGGIVSFLFVWFNFFFDSQLFPDGEFTSSIVELPILASRMRFDRRSWNCFPRYRVKNNKRGCSPSEPTMVNVKHPSTPKSARTLSFVNNTPRLSLFEPAFLSVAYFVGFSPPPEETLLLILPPSKRKGVLGHLTLFFFPPGADRHLYFFK